MSSGMMVRVWRKPETQTFIRRLREAGYHVTGDTFKYECWNDETLVFCALRGRIGYLCRINKAYVTEQDQVTAC